MYDNTIWEHYHWLSSTELAKNVAIRDEDHFLEGVQKIKAHNVDLARAWRRFYQETIFLVLIVALSDDACRRSHAIDIIDFPSVALIIFTFLTVYFYFLTKVSVWDFHF